ncbi:amino acid permease [Arthrobacter rhombi]|uniref:amino acid permease n=1 Tax=Arthrobacter rhombi TaxID=71253 RepID=UPI003FD495B5
MTPRTKPPGQQPDLPHASAKALSVGDGDYRKSLKNRQIQMIAIGGAIGTGLFMGAGGRLAEAGPGLVIAFAVCGFFAFLILRALGELVLHRPTSGSFVSYAREFFGEKAAFVTGWMYWLNWSMTAIVDITAAALYMHFFAKYVPWMGDVPQWMWALGALLLVLGANLVSVKVFGEMEFWFALIKVVALVGFLVVGVYFVIFQTPVDGQPVGFSLIAENGGILPNGLIPVLVLMQGVVFSYASIELLGTAAGETENPEKIMPKAINTVVVRIVVFYIGSLLLLSMLLPFTSYQEGESPFVTFFGSIGVKGMDAIMNLVVLTAALSSLNAGLYSTGRIMRTMALAGSAPKFASRMNRNGVPYGGILLTSVIAVLGVILNAIVPAQAFEIVLNIASLGIISCWAMIVLCQLAFHRLTQRGEAVRPSFRMVFAPWSGYLTLAFLFFVVVLMAFDSPVGTWTVASIVVIVPVMMAGWYACRGRVRQIAAQDAAGRLPGTPDGSGGTGSPDDREPVDVH